MLHEVPQVTIEIAEHHDGAVDFRARRLREIDALRLVDVVIAPEIVGVQEQELLGSYWGNHVLHGAQLGALWLLREGAPHFGVLDQFALDVKYARNFYDSDQRPCDPFCSVTRARC